MPYDCVSISTKLSNHSVFLWLEHSLLNCEHLEVMCVAQCSTDSLKGIWNGLDENLQFSGGFLPGYCESGMARPLWEQAWAKSLQCYLKTLRMENVSFFLNSDTFSRHSILNCLFLCCFPFTVTCLDPCIGVLLSRARFFQHILGKEEWRVEAQLCWLSKQAVLDGAHQSHHWNRIS